MTELVKEEKRRKKMEAMADDMFNNEVSLILFPYHPQKNREREIRSIFNLDLLSIYVYVLNIPLQARKRGTAGSRGTVGSLRGILTS